MMTKPPPHNKHNKREKAGGPRRQPFLLISYSPRSGQPPARV